jgi:hypothetical protein
VTDFEAARAIALNLLTVGNSLDESRVRAAAENAVRAISAQEPGHVVDIEALVRELEANLNVVVGRVHQPSSIIPVAMFPGSQRGDPTSSGTFPEGTKDS